MAQGVPYVPESPAVKRAWAVDYRARLIAEARRWQAIGRAEKANEYLTEARFIAHEYGLPRPPKNAPATLRQAA